MPPRRAWIWTAAGIGGFLVVLAGAVGFGTAYLRRSVPSYEAIVTIPTLHERVVIRRDPHGIPSIVAEDPHDIFFALGYVHAQDRLWQMELARRVSQGRLAEIFGPRLVDSDRFLRTIGLWRSAAPADSALDGDVRALVQAYADGVNACIQTEEPLPPEFRVLRIRPERWTVRHALAIGKLMTWDLTEWDLSLDLARAMDRLGAERASELLPRVPAWSPRTVPDSLVADTLAEPVEVEPTAERGLAGAWPAGMWPQVPAPLRPLLDGYGIARASNAWVVGPSRSRSGKPILANDMHLPLRAPSTWYLAGLHGAGFDVVGMTLPGVPGVIAGHSRDVAWGFTAAYVDNIDFFVEELDPADSTRYRTPDGWARLAFRAETITVRGAEDPVVHTVAETRHGPVLPPARSGLPYRAVTMQWTGVEATGEAGAVLRLNRARDASEVVSALRGFGNPAVNVVFADAQGTIGYWLAGLVPIRRSGDGVLPAPGASGEFDWIGWAAFESLPHVIDPPSGYVVSANNIPQNGGPYLGAHFMPGFRAARILDLVETTPKHDAASAHGMQLDVLSLFAERHFRRAVRAARDAGDEEAAIRLVGWDRRARAESRAAALFYTWLERVRWAMAADDYGDTLGYFPWEVLDGILESGESLFLDDIRTRERETLDTLSARALREAVALVGDRTWGEIHPLTNAHALGSVAWLDAWLGFDIGPVPTAGDPFTVNAAHHSAVRPPFPVTWGVSQRHVVDLGDPDGAGGFILPTGESGNPLSPHYADQRETWLRGGLWRIPVERRRSEETARSVTVLTPSTRRRVD
ncbi:MAG: penicillin acylase family protein [Gemmatimonadota bacterium]